MFISLFGRFGLTYIGLFCGSLFTFIGLFCTSGSANQPLSTRSCTKFVWRDLQRQCMGWLRLVNSLKSQVSFAEYRLFYRAFAKKTFTFKEPTNRSHPISYTGWQRPIGYLIFMGHFPQKSPTIIGSFAENSFMTSGNESSDRLYVAYHRLIHMCDHDSSI